MFQAAHQKQPAPPFHPSARKQKCPATPKNSTASPSWAIKKPNTAATTRPKCWKRSTTNTKATIISSEFTSLCPMTGQPDFATIVIRYIPDVKMVESKSLKLYLFSFRNHGDFHEDCVNIIMKDLIGLMNPKYIEVFGEFTPRGGIAIHPFANYGRAGTPFEQMARERLFRHDMQ